MNRLLNFHKKNNKNGLFKTIQNYSKLFKTIQNYSKIKLIAKFLAIVVYLSFYGCKQVSGPVPNLQQSDSKENLRTSIKEQSDELKLGKKLENPYTIKNMNTALKSMKDLNKPSQISSNYLYVRLEPKDSISQSKLERISGINLFAYPLDYELLNNGNKFKELNYLGKTQVYWAAIPKEYKMIEGISIQVIEELFLPEGDGNENFKHPTLSKTFLKNLYF